MVENATKEINEAETLARDAEIETLKKTLEEYRVRDEQY